MWLEWRGKTPADLGVDWEDVDTWWDAAMLAFKAGMAEAEKMQLMANKPRQAQTR